MGITAGAAIISAAGTSATVGTAMGLAGAMMTAETAMMIGMSLTVVGAVTGNENLSKMGAGFGLGSAVTGLATTGTSATQTGAAELGKDVASSGAQKVTDVGVANAVDATKAGAVAAQETAAPLATSTTVDGVQVAGNTVGAAAPPTGTGTNMPTVDAGAPVTDPEMAAGMGLGPNAQLGEAGAKAYADTMAQASQTALKAQADTAAANLAKGLTDSGSWWDWYSKLDAQGKAGVLQVGSGLVGGLGKGAGDYMAKGREVNYLKQQQARKTDNLRGQPQIGVRPIGTGLVGSNRSA